MSFLAGTSLALLGLAGLVAVVYFLKRQARLENVSTLFLWKGLEKQPRSALRFRWTTLLALFLQLIALAAIVVGLAQPIIFSASAGVGKLAILLDSSGSMHASNENSNQTRYQEGVEVARQLLRENPAAEVMVIMVQEHSEVLQRPTRDHVVVDRALARSEASFQKNGDLSELFTLLQSQQTRTFEQVVFITDNAIDSDVSLFGWDLVSVTDGTISNVALTQFSVREQPDGRGQAVFIEASNSNGTDAQLPLSIDADGENVIETFVTIPASQSVAFNYQLAVPNATRFRAQLGGEGYDDQWLADNTRYSTVPTPRPWKILWVGAENLYLLSFLELSDEIELYTIDSWSDSINPSEYDVVLLHGVDVPNRLSGRYILIDSSFAPLVSQGSDVGINNEIVDVRIDHPFLHNIDPTSWRFLESPEAEVDPQGKVLLSIAGNPVLYIFEKSGIRLAYLGANLDSSNLVLSIDFPILIYRLISWLSPRSDRGTTLIAGQEIPIYDADSEITVIDSRGRTCEYASGQSTCGKVDQPGFYNVFRAGVPTVYAVNGHPEESNFQLDTSSTQAASIAPVPIQASSPANLQRTLSLWPYFMVLGLIFLLAEFFIFDKANFSLRRLLRRKSS